MNKKLSDRYIRIGYEYAMTRQWGEGLKKRGYEVEYNKSIEEDGARFKPDLYANKNGEISIFEFKAVGDNNYKTDKYEKMLNYAERTGAEVKVIYFYPPSQVHIEVEDLGDIIHSHYIQIGIPQELDELSTHSQIEEVYIENISRVQIGKVMSFSGEGSNSCSLQYGSDSDISRDVGDIISESFPYEFDITLDFDKQVIELEDEIDTSGWYE